MVNPLFAQTLVKQRVIFFCEEIWDDEISTLLQELLSYGPTFVYLVVADCGLVDGAFVGNIR